MLTLPGEIYHLKLVLALWLADLWHGYILTV